MSEIEDTVCRKITARASFGEKKYGVSMADETLSRLQWLIHAQQEAMDLAVYLEKLIQEAERLREKMKTMLDDMNNASPEEDIEYWLDVWKHWLKEMIEEGNK